MISIELELDEVVMERARLLAQAQGVTIESVLTGIITRSIGSGEDADLMAELAAWEAASDEDWLKVEQTFPRGD